MNKRIVMNILGIYDLILAAGAIWIGAMMISKNGMFTEYPNEWLTVLPFNSWVVPGIIGIVLFGLGNIIAAIQSFKKTGYRVWLTSTVMSGILLIGLTLQVIILGEVFLATIEFFILGIIQLCITGYGFVCFKRFNEV